MKDLLKLQKLKNQNNFFLLLIVVLCVLGGITIFSSTYFLDNQISRIFINQLLFYILGIIIFFIISIFNVRRLNNKWVVLFIAIFSTSLLTLVLIGGKSANGAQRWIDIGPFTLQPSEFAKLFIILFSAFSFSYTQRTKFEKIFNFYTLNQRDNLNQVINLIRSQVFIRLVFSLLFLILTVLLVSKQHSLGNSVLITLTYILIFLSIQKINYTYLIFITTLILSFIVSFNILNLSNLYSIIKLNPNLFGIDLFVLILCLTLLFIIYRIFKVNIFLLLLIFFFFLPTSFVIQFVYNNVLESYQRSRIDTFLHPSNQSNLSTDYNKEKSLEAIGSSQLIGSGFLKGTVVNSGLLPFAYTDFAYASYSEQFGFIGSLFLILIYYLLISIILNVSNKSKDKYTKIIAYGIAIMIVLNVFQNIGMNIGLLPITGVPLPLISSGGSSVIVTFIGLGLVNSIDLDNQDEQTEVTRMMDLTN